MMLENALDDANNPRTENAMQGQFPAETEIYILPDGQVIVADLPVELLASLVGLTKPTASPPDTPDQHDAD